MSEAAAVEEFVNIQSLQKKNSTKNKAINAKKDAAKAAIIEHMIANNLTYIQVGDAAYLIINKKKSKQSFTPEFMHVLYRAFSRSQLNREVTEEEANAFVEFCSAQADRLGSSNVDLVMSKSKPLSVMLQDS
jgi:uncharacterized ferritin-like protein (DUF455 family)